MKNKTKLRQALGDALLEIIIYLAFFAIGALAVILFGGRLDSETLDFDLIALIGIAALLLVAASLRLLFLFIGKSRKKNAKKGNTGASVTKKCTESPPLAYTFTVDDNIRFLREINEGDYKSIFDHPYLAMYKRLYGIFGVKVQLNLFYEDEKFDLSEMTDRYREEWAAASGWLLLSFHSRLENKSPYEGASYDEVFSDCAAVQNEIIRFASESALAKTTTIHYCLATADGCRALGDNGVMGLLGLYGTEAMPRTSYQCTEEEAKRIRGGKAVKKDGIYYAAIDVILNRHTRAEISEHITALLGRPRVKIMIHEQYFYEDYKSYQPDFEDKLYDAFFLLRANGYESVFFEDIIEN